MNVLVVAIDTLRADHLGCYGYSKDTSPNIDALSRRSVLCERLFCPGVPTHPSFTTFYTGQHPIAHGIVSHGGKADLGDETPVLTELLLGAGYTTCAVDNLASSKSWFGRGYEFYIDPSCKRKHRLMVTCEEINSRAIPWLRSHADEKFFMFVHYWDPHTPYFPPERYRHLFYQGNHRDPNGRSLEPLWRHPLGQVWRDTWFKWLGGDITDADYVVALYDQEIRYVDDGVGELLGALDEAGVSDDTLVVLFGDHGESMTEHRIYFDHHGLYDCNLHVPLIVRWPSHLPEGMKMPHLVQHSDLAPTILDAVDLPIPDGMEDKSLLPMLSGKADGPLHSRLITEECTWQAKWAIRTDGYKFILSREQDMYGNHLRELYDLKADPGELNNLAEDRKDIAGDLERELEGWISSRLKALGLSRDPLIEQGITLGQGKKYQRDIPQ